MAKPRIRVPAPTRDSFQNFAARMGMGADNMHAQSSYGFNPISRNRVQLEFMYRGSWIVRQAVGVIPDDMTRAGIDIQSDLAPDAIEKISAALADLDIWNALNAALRWSRLYGGALAVMLIDGQKLDTPLQPDTISQGQFRGLVVLDRWMVQPSLTELITEYGPDLGKPIFYDVPAALGPLQPGRIHHSRVIRLDGDDLPYWQMITENGWGMSVVEQLYDRLVAFDSASTGAAQLVYKAYLRTAKLKDYRAAVAAGGKALDGITAQLDLIRKFQSNEGLTILDAEDSLETASYTFAGLSDVILQFGQQLSGALQIPLVRLFGQSPAGLNSTGDADIRNYYDGIQQQQERRLRRPMTRLLDILHRSLFGKPTEPGFAFSFSPLWQLSDAEKATVAGQVTTAVTDAFNDGVIGRSTALRELRQSSRITGIWSNIQDEDINGADEDPPTPEQAGAFEPNVPALPNTDD